MMLICRFFSLCFIFLIVISVSALPADDSPEKESSVEVVRVGNSADGVGITLGVYSPFHEEMKGIYGGAFTFNGQYSLNMSPSIDLLASVGLIRKEGNPYYDDPSFTSGERSNIRIIPIEVSLRKRFNLMKFPPRGLFIGAGLNYIRVSEKMPQIVSATGGDFGSHIFVGPQIFLREGLAFEGEIKLLINEIDMKSGNLRYPIALSGLTIKAGLMWYY